MESGNYRSNEKMESGKYRSSEKIDRVRSNDRYEKYYEQFIGDELDEESEFTHQSPSI